MVEPEWDEQTRNLVLAHQSVELCPVCHGPAYLCQDPELQDEWRADAPRRCHRQTAILRAQQDVTEKTNPQSAALMWSASLRPETR